MKLLFKQKMFAWFDSYNIFDEDGETVYTVKGQFSWGRCLKIFNPQGEEIGMLKQKVFAMMPTYEMYRNGEYWGNIKRAFSPLKPKFKVACNGWEVDGNFIAWDYSVVNSNGGTVAKLSKELFHLTDTYSLDIVNPEDALGVLMIALAIDADKAARSNNAPVVKPNN